LYTGAGALPSRCCVCISTTTSRFRWAKAFCQYESGNANGTLIRPIETKPGKQRFLEISAGKARRFVGHPLSWISKRKPLLTSPSAMRFSCNSNHKRKRHEGLAFRRKHSRSDTGARRRTCDPPIGAVPAQAHAAAAASQPAIKHAEQCFR
jgi:hypothetical protein